LAKTPEGTALLHLAIFNPNYETAALLVKRGADVNVVDAQQGSPIVNLMRVRRPDLCQNPCPKGTGILSSLDLAKLLLDSGANANAAPIAGRGAGFESKGADITRTTALSKRNRLSRRIRTLVVTFINMPGYSAKTAETVAETSRVTTTFPASPLRRRQRSRPPIKSASWMTMLRSRWRAEMK